MGKSPELQEKRRSAVTMNQQAWEKNQFPVAEYLAVLPARNLLSPVMNVQTIIGRSIFIRIKRFHRPFSGFLPGFLPGSMWSGLLIRQGNPHFLVFFQVFCQAFFRSDPHALLSALSSSHSVVNYPNSTHVNWEGNSPKRARGKSELGG